MRSFVCALIVLLFGLQSAFAGLTQIPRKPDVMPEFRVPRDGSRALDESWVYVQTLYDGATSSPAYWNAVPVGFAKANQGRAFIASLHTVFRTLDGGRTWSNLDPSPAPSNSPSFNSLRDPIYITDIAWRPVQRQEVSSDSLYLSAFNAQQDTGIVRLLRGAGNSYVVWAETLLLAQRWLTTIAAPDSNTGVAIAGLDARIFRNDSMQTSRTWDALPEHFNGTWVKEITVSGNFVYAVGSTQWLSLDRGYSWQTLPPADPLGDSDIDFGPGGARGIVGGGQDNPASGWVRYTTDFGQTWSARTLQTDIPIRTVLMISDSLGYAAGGLANDAIGRVWRTTDGGETWQLQLEADAEITELGYARESGGYINVIAAGYYADFRCGVWRSHVPYPDTIGAAMLLSQDTLRFYAAVGHSEPQQVSLKNVGSVDITVTDWLDAGPFVIDCCSQDVLLQPGDSMIVSVTFAPGIDGEYQNSIRVLNDRNEFLELNVLGSTLTDASPRTTLPSELSLKVSPNPGNAEFRLSYTLSKSSDVALRIFDTTGREVTTLVDADRAGGEHVLQWNASALPSGVYFAALRADGANAVAKLVLMK
ncbi:MAG: T9SS type A sorting domain-containing protein [Calditrichaeota bacterium]|nr:T9SS type A sorting domain-containing protein [Calditrichota bacterium]MCB9369353.1 T9SS type A sorting domain-containing protein [Calditrichota bacterium]